MRKYLKLHLFGLIILAILLPLKGRALTLPKLLPDCDQTTYQVQTGGKIPCQENATTKECVLASDYSESDNGKISGTYINRPCGFEDFVALLANGFSIGITAVALVTLFFFIWGAFGYILAAGSQEKIQKSTATIKGAVTGMLIVLGAWLIINFAVGALLGPEKQGQIFGQLWWQGTDCHQTMNKDCARNALQYGCGGIKNSATDRYVQSLQKTLNGRGDCACGDVDGCFGEQTKECVTSFQLANSILGSDLKPTGIVDDATWATIEAGGMCLAGSGDLLKGLPQPGDLAPTTCCVPNRTICPECSCYDSTDSTCAGRTKGANASYHAEGSKCLNTGACDYGCCIPDVSLLTTECTMTTRSKCTLAGQTFSAGTSCLDIPSCLFRLCVRSNNECLIQRLVCPAGYTPTGSSYTSIQMTTNVKDDLETCNYGTCVKQKDATNYSCNWMPRSKCNDISGAEFYYNERPSNSQTSGDIDGKYCNASYPL
ncbi:MAG: peptidoglycan-binding protein [Patescibacteria group bacterium]